QPPEESITLELDDPEAEAKLEAWEAAFYAQAKTSYEDVDLTLDGADGPETHVYRHTAVHLYMRDSG
ncbi:MAG: hypothetical protein KDA28_02230, partial [Phycisphaerales bacterium]|nr:hypothetical protein [Phycisphaerales bacterium]